MPLLVVPLVDLVIRNGRFVLPKGIVRGEISVDGGRIRKIAVSGLPKGEREIDVKDKMVIPGVIDAHVHLYDKGFLNREDFASGTSAAAAGGLTTVIVMPWDSPVISRSSIKGVVSAGEKDSIVDFALHAGNMTVESIKKVSVIGQLGVKSFKAFTCDPYRLTYDSIEELMRFVKSVDGVTFVHAEDDQILKERLEQVLKQNRKDLLAYTDSRPNEAEEKAVEKVAELAGRTRCRVHFAHITTRQGCDVIRRSKRMKIPVSAETCPHFLVFTRDDVTRLGPYLKMNPVLKTGEDRASLWRALEEGAIDIVATDHAPGSKEEKEAGWSDIWKAPSGVPGVETLLPLMLSEGVGKGRLTLERMVDALCVKPAQLFDLYPRKGAIRVRADADLVVLDLKKKAKVSAEKLHYKVGWTPYEGMIVKGLPVMTMVRGTKVVEDGEVVGAQGSGRFLPR